MNKLDNQERVSGIFLYTNRYVLGTPEGIAQSERTRDMQLSDLVDNYDLQEELGLLSAVLLKPEFPLLNQAMGIGVGNNGIREKKERMDMAAGYLSAFREDNHKINTDYLKKNGLIRILITDSELLTKVDKYLKN